ncbi:hypothetical protein EX30DRAFT_175935 [Ascodesmis nigricans]|uniref:Uncharacterized protein n=1 Tax=Ascodesmis nigricans TaxID=341454 RepID=A0A4S2MLE8_9PEZI|nr:hypothetical protein EX30DRAFT_175935 [Ascodesmis nigricans]
MLRGVLGEMGGVGWGSDGGDERIDGVELSGCGVVKAEMRGAGWCGAMKRRSGSGDGGDVRLPHQPTSSAPTKSVQPPRLAGRLSVRHHRFHPSSIDCSIVVRPCPIPRPIQRFLTPFAVCSSPAPRSIMPPHSSQMGEVNDDKHKQDKVFERDST